MTTINIAGLTPVDDPSYRYKMPKVTAKIEGRGNGIKTVLTNIIEVSLSLNRDAPEITKFFGCEIGSQTTYAAETERAVVNGAHTTNDLQNHLSKYIELFVLCKQCRLPETTYKVKNGVIFQKCAACGAKDPCEMTHKLTTFVLNQYKKNKAEKAGKDDKDPEKKKKEKKTKDGTDAGDEAARVTKKDKSSESKDKTSESKDKKKKKKRTGDDATADAGEVNEGEAADGVVSTGAVEEEEETDSQAVGTIFIIRSSQFHSLRIPAHLI